MEGKKSFVDELFPRIEEAKPTRNDSLNTIFPPRSTGTGKDSAHSECRRTGTDGKNQSTSRKNDKPVSHYELPESCLMSSSVYYGGRDDFIPQTSAAHNSGPHYSYKKNKEDDSGNSQVATRGDWWQGSFYY